MDGLLASATIPCKETSLLRCRLRVRASLGSSDGLSTSQNGNRLLLLLMSRKRLQTASSSMTGQLASLAN
jgi:hypothetical protein